MPGLFGYVNPNEQSNLGTLVSNSRLVQNLANSTYDRVEQFRQARTVNETDENTQKQRSRLRFKYQNDPAATVSISNAARQAIQVAEPRYESTSRDYSFE